MESYKIAYDYNQSSAKWMRWSYIVLGILFASFFVIGWYEGNLNWVHYEYLLIGIIQIFIGLFWYKQLLFNHSSAVLSDRGIRYVKKRSDEQTVD